MAGGQLAQAVRHLNLQQVRKAVVATSLPARRLSSSFALPYSSAIADTSRWGVREVGDYSPVSVEFGQTMTSTDYDQQAMVVTIENGDGTFRNRHAFDGDRRVLYESNFPFGELPVALERLEDVEETFDNVAYLSNTWVDNFYHWLLLTAPMLNHYERAGIELDHVYVGAPLKDWQVETLSFLGLRPEQVITRPCRAKNAHVAILTRYVAGIPPEQINWLRSRFVINEPEPGHRRLFVGRGSNATTRKMIDEQEIAERLEREFGFEYVSTAGMTLAEERELFSQAEAVVGPYGAALTNILFAPRGTKVLELQAFDNDHRINRCYQEMSAAFGNPHGFLRGQPTARKRQGSNSDISVPEDEVVRAVDSMLSHATPDRLAG